jgi:GDP-mannose 6-dehydrogenase
MRVTVIGLGHVGAVTAACLARDGHEVTGCDRDPARLAALARGTAPVREPGLDELIGQVGALGRLRAEADLGRAVRAAEAVLVCVGTPAGPDGGLALDAVDSAIDAVGAALAGSASPPVVALRSTVAPGTTRHRVTPRLRRAAGGRADLACAVLPEFFREGQALDDHATLGFPVLGCDDPPAAAPLLALAPAGPPAPRVVDTATAEALKLAANAWHATKVGFANEIAHWCAGHAIDGAVVMSILAAEPPLHAGRAYLKPGFAYGGPCLPKDLAALLADARARGRELPLLAALPRSNTLLIERTVAWVRSTGAHRVALVGLSFKPGTADPRGSPYVELARALAREPLALVLVDPELPADALPVELAQLRRPGPDALVDVDLVLLAHPHLLAGLDLPPGIPVELLSHLPGPLR